MDPLYIKASFVFVLIVIYPAHRYLSWTHPKRGPVMSYKTYMDEPSVNERNNSPAGGPVRWYNIVDEMEAFDNLPSELRAVLRKCAY